MKTLMLFLSFNLFSNSSLDEKWFDSKNIKWGKYSEEGYSKTKITQDNLSPLINLIKQTTFKSEVFKDNGELIHPNLISKVYACKFEVNTYKLREEAYAQFGVTIDHSAENSFQSRVKNLDDKKKLLSISDQEERKRYLIEEMFNLEYSNDFEYEVKETKSLMKVRQLEADPIVCIDHKLSIFDAASTLLHELIHFNAQDPVDYTFDQLKDESIFNELYFNQIGSEYDAFSKQCAYEQELRLKNLSTGNSKSPCSDSSIIDEQGALISGALKKIFLSDYSIQILYTRYSNLIFLSNGLLSDDFELSRGAISIRSKIRAAKRSQNKVELKFYEELSKSIEQEKKTNKAIKEKVDKLIEEIEKSQS